MLLKIEETLPSGMNPFMPPVLPPNHQLERTTRCCNAGGISRRGETSFTYVQRPVISVFRPGQGCKRADPQGEGEGIGPPEQKEFCLAQSAREISLALKPAEKGVFVHFFFEISDKTHTKLFIFHFFLGLVPGGVLDPPTVLKGW